MEGITKRVGRQAGYYKSRDGGREGVREGGREGWRISRMKELKPLYQLYRCISNIYDVMT